MQTSKGMGSICFLFITLLLAFSLDAGAEVLEGAVDVEVEGINEAAGAIWSFSRGPLLGAIALVVLIGAVAGAAASGGGNRAGGAIAGGLAAIAIVALVIYSPRIIGTMYTAAGVAGIPMSGGLPVATWGFPVATATALSYLVGATLWRRTRK